MYKIITSIILGLIVGLIFGYFLKPEVIKIETKEVFIPEEPKSQYLCKEDICFEIKGYIQETTTYCFSQNCVTLYPAKNLKAEIQELKNE